MGSGVRPAFVSAARTPIRRPVRLRRTEPKRTVLEASSSPVVDSFGIQPRSHARCALSLPQFQPRFQLQFLPNPAPNPALNPSDSSSDSSPDSRSDSVESSSDSFQIRPRILPLPRPLRSLPERSLLYGFVLYARALACRVRPVPVERDVGDAAAEAARDGGVEQRRLREPIRVRAAG